MEKLTILLLVIFILCLFSLGAGYKFSLSQYQEECYEHSWYNYTYCPYPETFFINLSNSKYHKSCVCPYMFYQKESCWQTISLPNTSDCIKYILVRYTH